MKIPYIPKKDYRPVVTDVVTALRGFASKGLSYGASASNGDGGVAFNLNIFMDSENARGNGPLGVEIEVAYKRRMFREYWKVPLSDGDFDFPEQKAGITDMSYAFYVGDSCWMSTKPDHTGNLMHGIIFGSNNPESTFRKNAAELFINHGALLRPFGKGDHYSDLREPINHLVALDFMLEELERMSK